MLPVSRLAARRMVSSTTRLAADNKLVRLTNTQKELEFDQQTHTGQAWDKSDYRLQRFDTAPKQVNPNVAMHLVAEKPPLEVHERIVYCDGGHPALGHPRIFINLDKPGTHACGYCGNRFFNSHATKGDDLKKHHITV